jgi:hypothetical protein
VKSTQLISRRYAQAPSSIWPKQAKQTERVAQGAHRLRRDVRKVSDDAPRPCSRAPRVSRASRARRCWTSRSSTRMAARAASSRVRSSMLADRGRHGAACGELAAAFNAAGARRRTGKVERGGHVTDGAHDRRSTTSSSRRCSRRSTGKKVVVVKQARSVDSSPVSSRGSAIKVFDGSVRSNRFDRARRSSFSLN